MKNSFNARDRRKSFFSVSLLVIKFYLGSQGGKPDKKSFLLDNLLFQSGQQLLCRAGGWYILSCIIILFYITRKIEGD